MGFGLLDCTGKVTLVTGGNGGIGLGFARGAAKMGSNIAIWARNAEKNAKAKAELEEYLHNELCKEDAADIREHMANCPDCSGEAKVGVVLTVARSLGEFGALTVVAGGVAGESQTLTLLVHARYIDDHNTFGAYSASTLLMALAIIALLLMTLLDRRRETE